MLGVVNEYQWRGLTVDVSGGDAMVVPLDEVVADAVIGAVRSCLENVVLHSGSNAAEVFFDASATFLSVMVVDHGTGFDLETVPDNRLGIRRSIVKRVESCGGTVRFWSAVGAGTSVVITVPLESADG